MGQQDTIYECEFLNLVFYFSVLSVCICLCTWHRITTHYVGTDHLIGFFNSVFWSIL